jgi:hypothetical protein
MAAAPSSAWQAFRPQRARRCGLEVVVDGFDGDAAPLAEAAPAAQDDAWANPSKDNYMP